MLLALLLACQPDQALADTASPSSDWIRVSFSDSLPIALPDGTTFTAEPICLGEEEYALHYRPGASDQLLIHMHGGGSCLDWGCSEWWQKRRGAAQSEPGDLGIFSTDDANPFADYTILSLPYCSGDLHGGHATISGNVLEAAGWRQHGFDNIAAALDLGRGLTDFTGGGTVVLSGSSAGGIATTLHAPALPLFFPDATHHVLNDSGSGYASAQDICAGYSAYGFAETLARYGNNPPPHCSDVDGEIEPGDWIRTLWVTRQLDQPSARFSYIGYDLDPTQSTLSNSECWFCEFHNSTATLLEGMELDAPSFSFFLLSDTEHTILLNRAMGEPVAVSSDGVSSEVSPYDWAGDWIAGGATSWSAPGSLTPIDCAGDPPSEGTCADNLP